MLNEMSDKRFHGMAWNLEVGNEQSELNTPYPFQ